MSHKRVVISHIHTSENTCRHDVVFTVAIFVFNLMVRLKMGVEDESLLAVGDLYDRENEIVSHTSVTKM